MNDMDALDPADLQAIWLTLKLASVTTDRCCCCIVTPLAWWLAHSRKWYKGPVAAVVALPLVLPPSVLGFYLLLLLGPHGAVGKLTSALNLGTLPFTFSGLVVGSVLFSMPFAVQPIQNAFEAMGKRPLEVAATLRASAWDRFLSVALPLARPGFLTATILAFAHTVGRIRRGIDAGRQYPRRDARALGRHLQPRRGNGVRPRRIGSRVAWCCSRFSCCSACILRAANCAKVTQ